MDQLSQNKREIDVVSGIKSPFLIHLLPVTDISEGLCCMPSEYPPVLLLLLSLALWFYYVQCGGQT